MGYAKDWEFDMYDMDGVKMAMQKYAEKPSRSNFVEMMEEVRINVLEEDSPDYIGFWLNPENSDFLCVCGVSGDQVRGFLEEMYEKSYNAPYNGEGTTFIFQVDVHRGFIRNELESRTVFFDPDRESKIQDGTSANMMMNNVSFPGGTAKVRILNNIENVLNDPTKANMKKFLRDVSQLVETPNEARFHIIDNSQIYIAFDMEELKALGKLWEVEQNYLDYHHCDADIDKHAVAEESFRKFVSFGSGMAYIDKVAKEVIVSGPEIGEDRGL